MLWRNIKKFRKAGVMIGVAAFMMTGCSDVLPEVSESGETVGAHEGYTLEEEDFDNAESIAAVYHDIYDEAVETNTLGSMETIRRIVARLGENGYVAVDSGNQVDMTEAGQVVEFCRAVDEKKSAALTIVVIQAFGFRKYDLEAEDGNVNIVRGYYQYDQNGCPQNRSTVSYPADPWQYTEEGYLIFEGKYFSEENFVLTLSEGSEHTALRVLPLDETCRELNRRYILPVGYRQNNIFLSDWREEDFGGLDFYDIFDIFYPVVYKQPVPYVADENLGVGAVYQIPEEIFENVIMTYFKIDRESLRRETTYISEKSAYEYRPRGFYEAEYPEIPYPEVVDYSENQDGTITLIVNAVYPNSNTSMAYSHRVVIRPLNEELFQFVSNQIIFLENDHDFWWHSSRLTKEEWIEVYGGTSVVEDVIDNTEEMSLWERSEPVCVLSAEEEQRLQDAYKGILRNMESSLSDPYAVRSSSESDEDSVIGYVGIYDFNHDNIPELIIGDLVSVGVFTFEDGVGKKIADLYEPEDWCYISGVYCKNNTIVLTSSGSDGSCYVCFTFLDGEGISQGKYVMGIYDEYRPGSATINGEVTTEEEFKKWFDITDLLDNSFIHRSRIKMDNGIAADLVIDAFEKDYEYISIEDLDFNLLAW